jgi:hypothetical protein
LSWFIRDDYTWFDIHHRKLLRKHRLAAGLHAMYSTHSTEYSYPLDRLRDLLGVAARSGEFERLLRAALDVLLEHKLVEGWRIAEKQLTVTPKLNQAKIAYLKRNGLPVPTSVLAVAEAPDKPNAGPTTWLQRFIEVAKRIATWARG